MNAAQEALIRRLRSRFFRVVSMNPDDMIPEMLYHYTSADGFHGIVKTGTLWAGNYSYLNDSSELLYGRKIASAVVLQRLEDEQDSQSRSFLKTLHDQLNRIAEFVDFYMTCFCRAPDLLSQWRGYGATQGRFCIGFDGEKLLSGDSSLIFLKHYAGPVVYDVASQRRKIEAALDKAMATLDEGGHDSPHFLATLRTALIQKLLRDLCFFKDPGFHEENEWRLVHTSTDTSTLHFQASGGILKPFVIMARCPEGTPGLPIAEVRVGSSMLGAQAKKSAELLLGRYDYPDVPVVESAVPFRDL